MPRRLHAPDASDAARRAGAWRRTYNPLRGLTAQRVTEFIESSERGACADLQWLIHWVARENAIMRALEYRFRAAISKLSWSVKIAEHCPPEDMALATAQQTRLKNFYHNLRGFKKSLEELAMANFRGTTFLEKALIKGKKCLDPVDPWFFVRDNGGPWEYNKEASSGTTKGQPLDADCWIIREVTAPVGRIAARLHVIRGASLADWQGFVETYGIPAIFAIMPEGITPEQVAEFQAIVERIIADARGTAPAGTDFKTISAGTVTSGIHKELADWCDEQLMIAALGANLTMKSQSGSGTLGGEAHMEVFKDLAEREAELVTEALQDQLDAPLLERWFPGQPAYAYFELAGDEEQDPDKVVDHAEKLHRIGHRVKRTQLEEKTGYEFEDGEAASSPPEAADAAKAGGPPEAGGPEASLNPASPPASPADAPGTVRTVENVAAGPETLTLPELTDATAPPDENAERLKALTKALDADFSGLRAALEAADKLPPGSPEYRTALEAARPMVAALLTAPPGLLAADKAFEELEAAGLLDGWGAEGKS